MNELDLHTCRFELILYKEYPSLDMYTITDDHQGRCISIGVPKGRTDIAEFILRSCCAGQNVLNVCKIKSIKDFAP